MRPADAEYFERACADRDRYRAALERIAATEPGVKIVDGKPQPWTHWRAVAQEALK